MRLIDANELCATIEFWIEKLGKEQSASSGFTCHVLQNVVDYIKTVPTMANTIWHTSDKIPALHHVIDDDGVSVYECDASDLAVVYKNEEYILAEYIKDGYGFNGWQECEFGSLITPPLYWMPLYKPDPRINVDAIDDVLDHIDTAPTIEVKENG